MKVWLCLISAAMFCAARTSSDRAGYLRAALAELQLPREASLRVPALHRLTDA